MRLDEQHARRAADAWLAQQDFALRLRTGRSVETSTSWIFETIESSGEAFVGNIPIVVDKRTGQPRSCAAARREFDAPLSIVERLLRWWNRRLQY